MTLRISLRTSVAALVIGAATVVYVFGGVSAQSAQQAPTAAEQSALSQLAAFRRSATAADAVPGETVLSGAVRRIGPSSAPQPVWASLSPTQDCVQVGREGAAACAAPERLEREPLIVGSSRAPSLHASSEGPAPAPEEWAGLAEDNVVSIEATYADGSSEAVPVTDSGFYLAAEGRTVTRFSWVTADGATHTYQEG